MQILINALKIGVTDPEARQISLESLAFENANIEFKKIIGTLRSRSAPIDKWIQNTMNVETFGYNDDSWVGELISKAMRRPQTSRCFNCGKLGHLKRNCRQRIIFPLGMTKRGDLSLQVHVGGVVKANIGATNACQQQTDKATR